MREQRDRLIAMKKAERDRAAGIDRTSGRFNNNNEDADKVSIIRAICRHFDNIKFAVLRIGHGGYQPSTVRKG